MTGLKLRRKDNVFTGSSRISGDNTGEVRLADS
jgi:hypothetical protein